MWCKISSLAWGIFLLQKAFAYDFDKLGQFLEDIRERSQVPGVAIIVVQQDKVLFSKTVGVLEFGKDEKVNEDTIFQLGSITKTFVAAGLGAQVDKKRLDFDEEIIRHLPEFALKEAYPSRFATARDLLAHRTGLPAFGGDILGKLGYSSQNLLYRIRLIEPATSFRNRPNYSNIGYFIAGELLAKVAKEPWEQAVKNTLLQPIGLKRTGFAANLENANVASAHALIDGKVQVIPLDKTSELPAAGVMTSTVTDMAQWMVMHLNEGSYAGKQVLQPKTIEALFTPSIVSEVTFSEAPPINKNANFSFCMGWDSYTYKGHNIIEKAGGLDGMRSITTLIPDLKLGITVLANLNLTFLPEAVRAKFLELCIGQSAQPIQKEIQEKEKLLMDLVARPKSPKNAVPIAHKLHEYTGVFENALYGVFKVLVKDNQLVVQAGPALFEGKLVHWSNDTFRLAWPVLNLGYQEVTFTFDAENKASSFQTESLGIFYKKASNSNREAMQKNG